MQTNVIEDVRAAETQAHNLKTAAVADARQRLRDMEEELASWKEDEVRRAIDETKQMIAQAERQSDTTISAVDTKSFEGRQELMDSAAANREKVIEMLIGRIVE